MRPFPDVNAGKWQISTEGGTRPMWGRDGRELFYADASQAMVSVPVDTSGPFSWSNPSKLFGSLYYGVGITFRGYDLSLDGRRFLMLKEQRADSAKAPSARIVVALNWIEDLKGEGPVEVMAPRSR